MYLKPILYDFVFLYIVPKHVNFVLVIYLFFQWPSDSFRLLEDSYYRQFIRNLVTFYKPSKNQFCSYEYGTDKARWAATAGCLLVDFLMTCAEVSHQFVQKTLFPIEKILKFYHIQ